MLFSRYKNLLSQSDLYIYIVMQSCFIFILSFCPANSIRQWICNREVAFKTGIGVNFAHMFNTCVRGHTCNKTYMSILIRQTIQKLHLPSAAFRMTVHFCEFLCGDYLHIIVNFCAVITCTSLWISVRWLPAHHCESLCGDYLHIIVNPCAVIICTSLWIPVRWLPAHHCESLCGDYLHIIVNPCAVITCTCKWYQSTGLTIIIRKLYQ